MPHSVNTAFFPLLPKRRLLLSSELGRQHSLLILPKRHRGRCLMLASLSSISLVHLQAPEG